MTPGEREVLTAIIGEASARALDLLAEHGAEGGGLIPRHVHARLLADMTIVRAGLALLDAATPPADLLQAVEAEASERVRALGLEWLGTHECGPAPHVGDAWAADWAIVEAARTVREADA